MLKERYGSASSMNNLNTIINYLNKVTLQRAKDYQPA